MPKGTIKNQMLSIPGEDSGRLAIVDKIYVGKLIVKDPEDDLNLEEGDEIPHVSMIKAKEDDTAHFLHLIIRRKDLAVVHKVIPKTRSNKPKKK